MKDVIGLTVGREKAEDEMKVLTLVFLCEIYEEQMVRV